MTFTIGSICWPEDPLLSLHLYLDFLFLAINKINVDFSDFEDDPIKIIRLFLDGTGSNESRKQACLIWWDYIDKKNALQDFQDRDILLARLAICLLSVSETDRDNLGEHLSWFLELIFYLNKDVDNLIVMMESYFKPYIKVSSG